MLSGFIGIIEQKKESEFTIRTLKSSIGNLFVC